MNSSAGRVPVPSAGASASGPPVTEKVKSADRDPRAAPSRRGRRIVSDRPGSVAGLSVHEEFG